MAKLQPGIDVLLRASHEKRRQSQIRASLSKSVSVQTKGALVERRAGRVLVKEETECGNCRKRIGSAAFAVLPGGGLAHIGCY